MNPEIKREWVEALRSGKYTQTIGALQNSSGFCCLGTLCDLYVNKFNKQWVKGKRTADSEEICYSLEHSFSCLPPVVIEWSEIESANPYFLVDKKDGTDHCTSLIQLNDDSRLSFPQIADLINYFF